MKTCTKCLLEKDESLFCKRSGRPKAYMSECKDCHNKRYSENKEEIRAHQNEYMKNYSIENAEKLREKNKKYRAENRERTNQYSREYKIKYPAKQAARNAVHCAKIAGKLKVQPCEICGLTERVNAHHDDYFKPLDVRWLCVRHHQQWHAKNGPGLNWAASLREFEAIAKQKGES